MTVIKAPSMLCDTITVREVIAMGEERLWYSDEAQWGSKVSIPMQEGLSEASRQLSVHSREMVSWHKKLSSLDVGMIVHYFVFGMGLVY